MFCVVCCQAGADKPAGYFTSRATSKGWIREATAYLQAARQLEVLTGAQGSMTGPVPSATGPNTDSLEEAVSLLQHHDAITGTEKQHVTDDYHVRLARGIPLYFIVLSLYTEMYSLACTAMECIQPKCIFLLITMNGWQTSLLLPHACFPGRAMYCSLHVLCQEEKLQVLAKSHLYGIVQSMPAIANPQGCTHLSRLTQHAGRVIRAGSKAGACWLYLPFHLFANPDLLAVCRLEGVSEGVY